MFNVYSLFSVNVFEGKIIVPINIHKKILNIIEEKYEKEGKRDSCVNGFQYHENFDGKKELNEIINKHLLSMHNLKIINGWLNVLENQSYNLPHSHTADDIKMAGVLYLKLAGEIVWPDVYITTTGKCMWSVESLNSYMNGVIRSPLLISTIMD